MSYVFGLRNLSLRDLVLLTLLFIPLNIHVDITFHSFFIEFSTEESIESNIPFDLLLELDILS